MNNAVLNESGAGALESGGADQVSVEGKALKPILSVSIAGLPKILSNGSHSNWRAVAAEKRKWKTLTMASIGCWPRNPLTQARAVFTRCSSREPDGDNLAISFKACRDALVEAGVLIDDKPSVLEAVYKWEKASPKNGKITIEIFERG